jgi:hypothetical protein
MDHNEAIRKVIDTSAPRHGLVLRSDPNQANLFASLPEVTEPRAPQLFRMMGNPPAAVFISDSNLFNLFWVIREFHDPHKSNFAV